MYLESLETFNNCLTHLFVNFVIFLLCGLTPQFTQILLPLHPTHLWAGCMRLPHWECSRLGFCPLSTRLQRAGLCRQQLDSRAKDQKHTRHTQQALMCVSMMMCVHSDCVSSDVRRNQTVLSYAHTGVSENTRTRCSPSQQPLTRALCN